MKNFPIFCIGQSLVIFMENNADSKEEVKPEPYVDWTKNPKMIKMMDEWDRLHWEGVSRYEATKESLGGHYL